MSPRLFSRRAVAAIAGSALALAACEREEATHHVVPKAAPPIAADAPNPHANVPGMGGAMPGAMPGGAMPGGMPSMAADPSLPPPPVPASGLKWTLPEGWKEAGGTGMRFATLTPSGPGRVEVSVVVLAGPAGGDLGNVNRWRGQIGLDPIDDAALATARQQKKAPGGTVDYFDYTSAGEQKTRLIAAILRRGEESWFVKMIGDEAAVARESGAFLKLLEGLRFE